MKQLLQCVFAACLAGACGPSSEPVPVGDDASVPDAATPTAGDAGSEVDAGADGGVLPPWNEGQFVVGSARFTVITPTLIRMEYDERQYFVDEPSYFAVEREARFHHAAYTALPTGRVVIDTGP